VLQAFDAAGHIFIKTVLKRWCQSEVLSATVRGVIVSAENASLNQQIDARVDRGFG
jgi:hypothetical protein